MKKLALVGALVVVAGGAVVYWQQAQVPRALDKLASNPLDGSALSALAEHTPDERALPAIVRALKLAALARDPPPAHVMTAVARAFDVEQPAAGSAIADAVSTCVIRHALSECRALIPDYDTNAAVTAAIVLHLERSFDPRDATWRDWQAPLTEMVGNRPKTPATLDVLIAAWRRAPLDALVPLIRAFDHRLIEERMAATSKIGSEEVRLLLCQAKNCNRTDIEPLVKLVRERVTVLAPDDDRDDDLVRLLKQGRPAAWQAVSILGARLTTERAAFVLIGKDALPELWRLYASHSHALWSFAAMTIAGLDRVAFLARLEEDERGKNATAAAKAAIARAALGEP